MAHSSNGGKDDPLMKMYEAQAMVVEKEEELQQQRVKLEIALQEIEQLRLVNEQQRFDQAIAATEKKFEEQLTEMRRQFEGTLAEENAALKESIVNIEDKIKIDKENYQENMKNVEAQLAEKEETIDGIRQHFETKIETLQRRIDEQSRENENLRAGQLEKANKEIKTMMENMPIQLNVSAKLEFHSSALILGGRHPSMTDSICIFDSKENKWRKCKQKLPFKVANHGSAILNDKIYIMGGENHLNGRLASCYKLGESGEWTKMAEMNEKKTGISQSTIVFGSEIWVIGGWNGRNVVKTVEKYNPQTDFWTQKPGSSASIVDGKIFVSGGWDGTKRLKSVEVYDPAKNNWEIFCDMPLELNRHCSIVEGTNLITIGGIRDGEVTPSDEVWKIDVFDPKKEWIKIPSLKQGRYNHGAIKLSNGIMVFGGSIDINTRIDSVEIFDGTSWKEGPKLSEKHGAFSFSPLSIKTEKQLLLQLF